MKRFVWAEESDVCSQRPQFGLSFLLTSLLLVGTWAACFAWTVAGRKVVLAVFVLMYLFGCWKSRRAVLFLLPAMYLPYSWVFAGWPWDSYQRQWIAILWQLSVLVAEMIVHPLDGWLFEFITASATLVLFFAFLMPARRSVHAAMWASSVLFVVSLACSYLSYLAFRA